MHLISPYSHDTAAPYTLQGAATFGGKIKQGDVERQVTFLDSPSLEISSICLTPLTRASMTRVDVTSFSLKKRFTTPYVQNLTVRRMTAIIFQNQSLYPDWSAVQEMQLLRPPSSRHEHPNLKLAEGSCSQLAPNFGLLITHC